MLYRVSHLRPEEPSHYQSPLSSSWTEGQSFNNLIDKKTAHGSYSSSKTLEMSLVCVEFSVTRAESLAKKSNRSREGYAVKFKKSIPIELRKILTGNHNA